MSNYTILHDEPRVGGLTVCKIKAVQNGSMNVLEDEFDQCYDYDLEYADLLMKIATGEEFICDHNTSLPTRTCIALCNKQSYEPEDFENIPESQTNSFTFDVVRGWLKKKTFIAANIIEYLYKLYKSNKFNPNILPRDIITNCVLLEDKADVLADLSLYKDVDGQIDREIFFRSGYDIATLGAKLLLVTSDELCDFVINRIKITTDINNITLFQMLIELDGYFNDYQYSKIAKALANQTRNDESFLWLVNKNKLDEDTISLILTFTNNTIYKRILTNTLIPK